MRTLDPGLTLLTHTLAQPGSAPTWVVRWDSPHTWRLDPHNHLTNALETHYRQVAVVCGHPVWAAPRYASVAARASRGLRSQLLRVHTRQAALGDPPFHTVKSTFVGGLGCG